MKKGFPKLIEWWSRWSADAMMATTVQLLVVMLCSLSVYGVRSTKVLLSWQRPNRGEDHRIKSPPALSTNKVKPSFHHPDLNLKSRPMNEKSMNPHFPPGLGTLVVDSGTRDSPDWLTTTTNALGRPIQLVT